MRFYYFNFMRNTAILMLGVFIGFIILAGIYSTHAKKREEEAIKNLALLPIHLDNLSNGVYIGTFRSFHYRCGVEVSIVGGKIERITFLQYTTPQIATVGARMGSQILVDQTLELPFVSENEIHRKIVLKTITNALTNQPTR